MKPQYMSVALGECVPEGCFLPLIQLGIFESVINFIKANYVLNLGHNFIVIVVAMLVYVFSCNFYLGCHTL